MPLTYRLYMSGSESRGGRIEELFNFILFTYFFLPLMKKLTYSNWRVRIPNESYFFIEISNHVRFSLSVWQIPRRQLMATLSWVYSVYLDGCGLVYRLSVQQTISVDFVRILWYKHLVSESDHRFETTVIHWRNTKCTNL